MPTLKTKITNSKLLSAGALVLAAIHQAQAQYTPPPPPTPFQGFINEYLRAKDPYMNQWDFAGTVRLRYESKQGYGIQGIPGSVDFLGSGKKEVNNDYLLSKILFHAGYTEKWWSAYVEGRSSLAYNDARYAYFASPLPAHEVIRKGDGPEADVFDLNQAYVTIGNHKEFPLSVKIGRQALAYGDERLVGAFAWNNIGRVFDAAKVRWQNGWFGADFFTSATVVPEDGTFNNDNPYDWFSGVYLTSMKVPKNTLDLYFLSRNASRKAINVEPSPQFGQPTARDIYTIGGRLKSKPNEFGNFDYTVEGAYQFGDYATSATAKRLNQDAYMFCLQGGYTFADWWATPRLGAEFDYSSGDDNSTDGTHGTFDNLFPTNHKFYGSMDLVSLQNIQDLGVNLTLKPTPRLSVALMGNAFWLANTHDQFYAVTGAARPAPYGIHPTYDSFVGTELTAVAGYAVTRFAQLETGYGHFFTGDYVHQTLAASGGDRDADWVYVQTTVNF